MYQVWAGAYWPVASVCQGYSMKHNSNLRDDKVLCPVAVCHVPLDLLDPGICVKFNLNFIQRLQKWCFACCIFSVERRMGISYSTSLWVHMCRRHSLSNVLDTGLVFLFNTLDVINWIFYLYIRERALTLHPIFYSPNRIRICCSCNAQRSMHSQ